MNYRVVFGGLVVLGSFVSVANACPWTWLTGKRPPPTSPQLATFVPPAPVLPDWGQIKTSKSLSEIANAPLGAGEKKLVDALLAEKGFSGGDPFTLSSYSPFVDMLSRGVTSFKRDAYTSVQNRVSYGTYDVLRYRVTHPDGTESVILAYRQSSSPYDVMIGGLDMRPTTVGFYVADGKGFIDQAQFTQGKAVDPAGNPTRLAAKDGLAISERFIDQSLANRGLSPVGAN